MAFTTELNNLITLHERLLEATREEHGDFNYSYTLDDLFEDLNDNDLDELLTLDLEELYCTMEGNNYQRLINSIESGQEPLNLPPPPRRVVESAQPPPLYEDAVLEPPPYTDLPPY